jgi:hypothetical protein
MTQPPSTGRDSAPGAPSPRALARATAIALVVAAVVLMTIVLPAEYGMDPLGTGAATGLINLSRTPPAPIVASASGPLRTQPADFKTDTRQFGLLPYGGFVEYKYPLKTGATILYTWQATGDVNFDMHTEPAGKPPEASDSFERGTAREGRGSYTAPYDGIHGWYWENMGETPVTITVTTVGFYTGSKEFRDDGTTREYPAREFSGPATDDPAP